MDALGADVGILIKPYSECDGREPSGINSVNMVVGTYRLVCQQL